MKKQTLAGFILGALLLSAAGAVAQSAYFQAVTNLNPVGYWPMHEVEAAAPGDIETNYGTIGPLGTGYYNDWASPIVTHGVTGALVNDPDPAATFGTEASGNYTNCLSIPHTSPLVTLRPPFSVECWWKPNTGGTQGDIWSEMGLEGVNAGGTYGAASGVINGTRLFWNPNFYLYVFNNTSAQTQVGNSGATTAGVWHHVVVTCDAQTNFAMYVDSVLKVGPKTEVGFYAPDYWSPITFANGRGYTRNASGGMDEFAIYTNVISDITTHYTDGTTGAAGQYFSDVTNDNPVVYLRMDSPAYIAPAVGTWPILTNYGSTAINGVYSPGTMPGAAAGPANASGQPFQGLSGANVTPFSGVSSFADAGNTSAYNPVGAVPFSVTAMFHGNPSDQRYQNIVGHSDGSWRISMNLNGKLQCTLGTNTDSVVISSGVYNDGNWHQVVNVYTPASDPNVTGTNAIYVDGLFDTAVTTVSTNGIGPGSALDVMIGADPQYTNTPGGLGRQFAGQVCEAALFTNALTAGQVQTLYNAAEAPPSIKTQPASAVVGQGGAYTNVMVAVGSASLSYQWFTNGVALAGQTNASLVLNPVLSGQAGTNYYVIITNNYGAATSAVVSLTVNSSPSIGSQFPLTYTSPFTLYAGAYPTFSVSASGSSPIFYRWFTNGVLNAAATNSSLTLTNVQTGAISDYCIVSNAVGTATSIVWSASVIADPINPNGLAPYPQAVLALKPVGYWRLNETEIGGGDAGVVCLDYAGGNDAIYTNVNLGNSGYNPTWDPSDTSGGVGTVLTHDSYAGQIGQNIDFAVPAGGNAKFSVEVWMKPNRNPTYLVYANNFPGGGIVAKGYLGTEEFALDNNSAVATNCFRFFVRDASGVSHAANSAVNASQNQWYHVVGVCDEANSNVLLYVNGTLAASAAVSPLSGILGSSVNMSIGSKGVSDIIGFPLQTVAFLNDVAVFNYALSSNQVANEYNQAGLPPVITQQPLANVYMGQGSNLTLSAAAGGTPPLFYEWFDVNSNLYIPGQTNATLLLTNIVASDSYYLTVTNLYGSTNSSTAVVQVYAAPLIISYLPLTYTNLYTLFAGASPKFSISALAFQPLYYQWFRNGAAVSGATNATFQLANVAVGGVTNYCVLSNFVGSVTSFVWTASVIADPGPSYPQAVLAAHPIGYWRLNEGPDDAAGSEGVIANDYLGGNNGIFTNVTLAQSGYTASKVPNTDPATTSTEFGETGISFFDSDAGQIAGVDFAAPTNTSVTFSVEAWVNGFNGGQISGAGIVSKGSGGGGEQFCLDLGGTGTAFRFFVRDAAGAAFNAPSTFVTDGNWHHVVGVCDESNGVVSLYIDGLLAGHVSIGTKVGLHAATGLMTIGSRMSSAVIDNNLQFYGFLNDVAVYNYALSQSQVAAQYSSSGGVPPFFIQQPPTNASAVAGTTLTVSGAAVAGTLPLTNQWWNATLNSAIAGQTNSTLIITNVSAGLNGDQLYLVSTNAFGGTNSTFVTLTISTAPPTITITNSGGVLQLNWNIGTLQSSTNVVGPYLDLTNTSPYTVVITNRPQQFYRVHFP